MFNCIEVNFREASQRYANDIKSFAKVLLVLGPLKLLQVFEIDLICITFTYFLFDLFFFFLPKNQKLQTQLYNDKLNQIFFF